MMTPAQAGCWLLHMGVLGTLCSRSWHHALQDMLQATGEGAQIRFLLGCFPRHLTELTRWTNVKLTDVNICISAHSLLAALEEHGQCSSAWRTRKAGARNQSENSLDKSVHWKTTGKTHHNMFTFFNHKATKWSLLGEWVIIAVVLCWVSVCRKMSARQSKQHDQPRSGLSTGTNAAFKCRHKHCNYALTTHIRPK